MPILVVFAGSYDQFEQFLQSSQSHADFIRTSLLVSGIEPQQLDQYSSQLEWYLAELQGSVPSAETEYELGQWLLSYLHATRLKRYDSSQASVHILLDKGKFNCISSTLFYIICARRLGLSVEAIRAPKHVFCRVKTGETWTDVETTSKHGFDPGTKGEFLGEFRRVTGFSYLPPKNYKYRQSISDVYLLSLVVQNRLTSSDSKKDPRTLRLAMEWYGRVADESGSKELVYAWSKYVTWLNRNEYYDEAVIFVKDYKSRFGATEAFRESVQTLVQSQILILIDKKRFDTAEQLLDQTADVLSLTSIRTLAEYMVSKVMKNANRSEGYDHVLALTGRLLAKGYVEEHFSQKYSQYLQSKKLHDSGRRK